MAPSSIAQDSTGTPPVEPLLHFGHGADTGGCGGSPTGSGTKWCPQALQRQQRQTSVLPQPEHFQGGGLPISSWAGSSLPQARHFTTLLYLVMAPISLGGSRRTYQITTAATSRARAAAVLTVLFIPPDLLSDLNCPPGGATRGAPSNSKPRQPSCPADTP